MGIHCSGHTRCSDFLRHPDECTKRAKKASQSLLGEVEDDDDDDFDFVDLDDEVSEAEDDGDDLDDIDLDDFEF